MNRFFFPQNILHKASVALENTIQKLSKSDTKVNGDRIEFQEVGRLDTKVNGLHVQPVSAASQKTETAAAQDHIKVSIIKVVLC